MKVLWITNHVTVSESARDILQQIAPGLRILDASAASTGKVSKEASPDLVLLDVDLPQSRESDLLHWMAAVAIPAGISSHTGPDSLDWRVSRPKVTSEPSGISSLTWLNEIRRVIEGQNGLAGSVADRMPNSAIRLSTAIEEEAITILSSDDGIQDMASPVEQLTPRQQEVLDLIVKGKPNKLIARELGLALGTVRCHVSSILRALNVSNRTQVAAASGLLNRRNVPEQRIGV
jgi:DNA-binding NarL/FixJ family response regulator